MRLALYGTLAAGLGLAVSIHTPRTPLTEQELVLHLQAMDNKSGQPLIAQLIKMATGMYPDELHTAGGTAYPQENNVENQGGHRLAAKLMTQRLGFFPTQMAGLANEGLEAATNKAATGMWFPNGGPGETMRDLGANWRGSVDALNQGATALPTALQSLLGLVNPAQRRP